MSVNIDTFKQLLITALVAGALLFSMAAHSNTAPIKSHIDASQLVGKARMKVMLWNVFDARLFSQSGDYDANAPFALELTYLRKLAGRKIVQKTIEEIIRQESVPSEKINRWKNALLSIIPDVKSGTTITGIRTAEAGTVFYLGEQSIGQIDDPHFTRLFFDIWLGDNTSHPALRNRLVNAGTQP